MNRVWTENEKTFIANNCGKVTDAEGARQLSLISGRPVSIHAWRKQRQKLTIKKAPGRGVCRLAQPMLAGEVINLNQPLHIEMGVGILDNSPAQLAQVELKDESNSPAEGNGANMISEGGPVLPTNVEGDCAHANHNDF